MIGITVAGLALIVPASAAAEFRPADSYPELGAVLPIARAAWPDSPCRDREMVSVEPAPLINSATGYPTRGTAWPGTCNIEIEDSLLAQPELMCWVITHELGHLSGIWEHSTDPTSVMAVGGRYAPCAVLAPPAPVIPAPTPAPAAAPTTGTEAETREAKKRTAKKHRRKHLRKKCSRKKTRQARRSCRRDRQLVWTPDR